MSEARPEKVAAVRDIKGHFTNAEAVVVTEYRGLTVAELAELRRGLRPVGGKYKVYKNTLARRAAAEAEVGDEFTELFLGPTALAFTDTNPDGESGDVVSVAKALKDFAKTHPNLVVKGGLYEGAFIDAAAVSRLADIEPREVLLAKLAGLMQAPMQQFAGLLAAVPRNFAYGLKALIEEGGAPGAPADAPAPEAEAPAEEAAPAADEATEEAVAAPEEAATEAPAEAAADETSVEAAGEDAAAAEDPTENQESE